ncbi:PiggyBac transposable element-derived protein 4-like [Plakobranchus ocellatus]|uniref:PiggyBac transposable element-derived protein 4-like n=1 Tax=Plakobranchus ocellatus TaxID=259542 RepID=A0AAV4B0A7_9GAST|nr:PiggyBac transposable element-derived protein 4-like [Plakobranchus ocellatus]
MLAIQAPTMRAHLDLHLQVQTHLRQSLDLYPYLGHQLIQNLILDLDQGRHIIKHRQLYIDLDLMVSLPLIGDRTSSTFRFLPSKPPGVQPGILPDECTPMDAFLCIFTEEIIDSLVESINAFATRKCQQNNPPTKRSRFGAWYPATRAEMYKFFATVTLMGIDPVPVIQVFWSTNPFHYKPIYHQLFAR